jgi:hypothetical protein
MPESIGSSRQSGDQELDQVTTRPHINVGKHDKWLRLGIYCWLVATESAFGQNWSVGKRDFIRFFICSHLNLPIRFAKIILRWIFHLI